MGFILTVLDGGIASRITHWITDEEVRGVEDTDHKRIALERGLTEALAKLPDSTRDVAIEHLAELIHHILHAERMRCVNLCRARAALWRTTRMATSDSTATAAAEARARANEAEYLADALDVPRIEVAALDA